MQNVYILLTLGVVTVAVVTISEYCRCRGGGSFSFVGIVEVAALQSRHDECTAPCVVAGQILPNHCHQYQHLAPGQSLFRRRYQYQRQMRHFVTFALPFSRYHRVRPFESRNKHSHHFRLHDHRVVIIMPEPPMYDSSHCEGEKDDDDNDGSSSILPSWQLESSQHLEKIAHDYQLPILLEYDSGNMEQAPEYTSYTHYLTAVPYPRTNSYAISIGTIIRNLVSSTNIMKNKQERKKGKSKISSTDNSYFVDLCPPPDTGLGYRLQQNSVSGGGGGEELLLKALGMKKMLNNGNDDEPFIIYDLTAGLARDSLVILKSFLEHQRTLSSSSSSYTGTATPQLKLHMVERDPIVALLLSDAMRRLNLLADEDVDASNPSYAFLSKDERRTTQRMKQYLSMEKGDGVSVLNRLMNSMGDVASGTSTIPSTSVVPYPPDICYLDPMFPPRKKQKSAVKKDMAMLHSLLGTAEVAKKRDGKMIADEDGIASEVLAEGERLKEEQALILAACKVAKKRVVVKRPIGAKPLGLASEVKHDGESGVGDPINVPKPSYDVRGSVNRFDVYLVIC